MYYILTFPTDILSSSWNPAIPSVRRPKSVLKLLPAPINHCTLQLSGSGRMGPCGRQKNQRGKYGFTLWEGKREELKRKKTPAKMWPLTPTFRKISFDLWLTINFATRLWCRSGSCVLSFACLLAETNKSKSWQDQILLLLSQVSNLGPFIENLSLNLLGHKTLGTHWPVPMLIYITYTGRFKIINS